jgi:hypothetical protein
MNKKLKPAKLKISVLTVEFFRIQVHLKRLKESRDLPKEKYK